MLCQRRKSVEEVTLSDRRELLRGLGAVTLRDGGDDVFLGAEVAIEIAGTHSCLGADFLHRGLMEARARETGLRRDENFVAAVGRKLHIGPTHEIVPRSKKERTFIR